MSLPAHFESNVVSQNVGESQEDFYKRLERECKPHSVKVKKEVVGPCPHDRSFGEFVKGRGLVFYCSKCGAEVERTL